MNGKPLGRPPGAKKGDPSKIKKSSRTTSGVSSSSSSRSGLRTINSNATRKTLREGLSERDNLIAQQQAKNEELTRELERFRAEKLANSSSGNDARTA